GILLWPETGGESAAFHTLISEYCAPLLTQRYRANPSQLEGCIRWTRKERFEFFRVTIKRNSVVTLDTLAKTMLQITARNSADTVAHIIRQIERDHLCPR